MYTNLIHIEAMPETVSPLLEALRKDIHTGEWAQDFHTLAGGTVRDAELPTETAYSVHAHGAQLHVLIIFISSEVLCWLVNTLAQEIGEAGLIEIFSTNPEVEGGWWYAAENGNLLVNRAAIGFAEANDGALTFILWEGGVYTVNEERYSFEDAYSLAYGTGEIENEELWNLFR